MSRSSTLLVALALFGGACTPPPDLGDDTTNTDPSDLDNLSLADVIPLFFLDFAQDDERLADLVDVLERELAEGVVRVGGGEKVPVDVGGPKADREFTIDPLPLTGLDVTYPAGAMEEGQNPLVVFGRSRHDIDTNVDVLLEKNQVCIESSTTKYYSRTYGQAEGCFADASCTSLTSENEVLKELSIFAAGWYDLFKDFKRFQTNDGRQVVVARSWIEKEVLGHGGGRFGQTFTSELWIENAAGTVDRMYAIWAEIDIGFSDNALRDLTSNSLDEGFQRADDFGDGGDITAWCGEPRDREYTRAADTAE